jgi:hypothetical protein
MDEEGKPFSINGNKVLTLRTKVHLSSRRKADGIGLKE